MKQTATLIENNNLTFYKKLIAIGIPVVLQNLLAVGLNLVDTLMIGRLGEIQLAGVGAANQIYFVFTILVFGLVSGSTVYSAQYYGAKDFRGIKKVLGLDYIFAIVMSAVAICIAILGGHFIVSLFSKDAAVAEYGVRYIRIAAISYVFAAISYVISFNSRAIQRVTVPTVINAAAIATNAVLNYILIFGKLGISPMGVEGAAAATLTARIIECAAMIIYVYSRKEHMLKAKLKELIDFDKSFCFDVCRRAFPVVLSEGSWALSVAMVYAAFGHISTAALACSQIANVISDMLQSFFYGVGCTASVLIGEALGKNSRDEAKYIAKQSLIVLNVLAVIISVIMFLISKPIAGIYSFEADTLSLLVHILRIISFLIIIKGNAYIFICGILRGGGDTVFCMNLEFITNLIIHVPTAFACVMLFGLDLPLTLVICEVNNLIKAICCYIRYKKDKWINVLVE